MPGASIQPALHRPQRTVPIPAPVDLAARAAPLVLALGLVAATDRLADGGPFHLALAVLLLFGALAIAGIRRRR
jgi:hypothetical protein